jgi:ABC-type antimicrobial peptide transport system permease subunit
MYLKNCVVIVADLISEIGVILDDKKVEFKEILGLAGNLFTIPQLVRQMPQAIAEIKSGVNDAYLAEIKKEVAIKLKLNNQNTEKIVEACINWILITSVTVNEITKNVKALK